MKIINHKIFSDDRGILLPIEFYNIQFTPKRIFIVNNVPIGFIRGCHAHYDTIQYILCLNGSIDVILHNGKTEEIYHLYKNQSILVPKLIWDSQKFLEENSEILVLCSTEYNISDYIFDFNEFIKIKNIQK